MNEARGRGVYTSRGPVEGEDWPAVAHALNERMATRRVGQQELSELSGVSVSTVRQVQHGAGRRVQNRTLAALSRALGWPEGHLAEVLLGAGTIQPEDREIEDGEAPDVVETLRRIEAHVKDIRDRLATIERAVDRRR